jgi:hypothetical protein
VKSQPHSPSTVKQLIPDGFNGYYLAIPHYMLFLRFAFSLLILRLQVLYCHNLLIQEHSAGGHHPGFLVNVI